MAGVVLRVLREDVREVKEGKFPTEEHYYRMAEGEEQKFLDLLGQ